MLAGSGKFRGRPSGLRRDCANEPRTRPRGGRPDRRVQDLAGVLLPGRDEHRIVGRRIREHQLDLPGEADFGSHVQVDKRRLDGAFERLGREGCRLGGQVEGCRLNGLEVVGQLDRGLDAGAAEAVRLLWGILIVALGDVLGGCDDRAARVEARLAFGLAERLDGRAGHGGLAAGPEMHGAAALEHRYPAVQLLKVHDLCARRGRADVLWEAEFGGFRIDETRCLNRGFARSLHRLEPCRLLAEAGRVELHLADRPGEGIQIRDIRGLQRTATAPRLGDRLVAEVAFVELARHVLLLMSCVG